MFSDLVKLEATEQQVSATAAANRHLVTASAEAVEHTAAIAEDTTTVAEDTAAALAAELAANRTGFTISIVDSPLVKLVVAASITLDTDSTAFALVRMG